MLRNVDHGKLNFLVSLTPRLRKKTDESRLWQSDAVRDYKGKLASYTATSRPFLGLFVNLLFLVPSTMAEYNIQKRKAIPALGFFPREVETTGVSISVSFLVFCKVYPYLKLASHG